MDQTQRDALAEKLEDWLRQNTPGVREGASLMLDAAASLAIALHSDRDEFVREAGEAYDAVTAALVCDAVRRVRDAAV